MNISAGAAVRYDCEYEDMASSYQVLWNRLLPWRPARKVPTLVDVPVSTATVSNTSQGDVEQSVDLLPCPPVASYGLLKFGAIARIIEVSATSGRAKRSKWLAVPEQE